MVCENKLTLVIALGRFVVLYVIYPSMCAQHVDIALSA